MRLSHSSPRRSGVGLSEARSWEKALYLFYRFMIRPTREAVDNAQFYRWYPMFRPMTIKSIILPLPASFIRWLQTDGVTLPSSVTLSSTGKAGLDNEQDGGGATDEGVAESFPELERAMTEAIEELGGEVCPKMNWSVPRDAEWVNGGTLKCETAGDVMLLLKSSDFIQHDIAPAYDDCHGEGGPSEEGMILALRKWASFHPSMHFRCFVQGHAIAGDEVPRLARLIIQFFVKHISGKYPDPDYVMDVYVDKRDRVWLIDFNVYGQMTDALLFSWEEELLLARGGERRTAASAGAGKGCMDMQVAEITSRILNVDEEAKEIGEGIRAFRVQMPGLMDPFVFRVVGGQNAAVGPDPLAPYRVPIDISMGAIGGGEGAIEMEEMMRRCMNRDNDDSDSSRDGEEGE